jgi:hypothetical protein
VSSASSEPDRAHAVLRLIAHELRNPLTAVQLNAQLIERALRRESRAKELAWAAGIVTAARRMEHMIELLVEAERLRSGRSGLALEPLVFASWLAQCLVEAPLAFDRTRLQVETASPTLAILADPRRLKSVMLTLLDLAGAYSPQGPVLVNVCKGQASPTLHCSILVERQGGQVEDAGGDGQVGEAGQVGEVGYGEVGQLSAGRDVEIHYVRTVLQEHRGELRDALGDTRYVGFEVVLPIPDVEPSKVVT